MADWQPAASVMGLFKSSLVESLGSAVEGVIPGVRPASPVRHDFVEHLAAGHQLTGHKEFVRL